MIYCQSGLTQYHNDIAEVIRVFYPLTDIVFVEQLPKLGKQDILVFCNLLEETVASVFWQGEMGLMRRAVEGPLKLSGDVLENRRIEKRAVKRAVFRAMQGMLQRDLPWGCLTGIRPTKLVREMLRTENPENVKRRLQAEYFVSAPKTDLALEIVHVQQPLLESAQSQDYDLYVSIPFCRSRCVYCSFTAYELGSYFAKKEDIKAYLAALTREIKQNVHNAKQSGRRLRALYVGGGTPTALTCVQLRRVLETCLRAAGTPQLEFTVEAGRPDTIDRAKLSMMKELGVTRLSINPQSMHEATLERIGRSHTKMELLQAYEWARDIGFDCVNMDIIIGLPGENADMVAGTIGEIARLAPENLTVHTLAIKRSSRLKTQLGEMELPDGQEARKMLETAQKGAVTMGMSPYYMYRQKYMRGDLENVGYALPGKISPYNVDIMEETVNILALGAGAISKWRIGGQRLEREANAKDLPTYIAKIDEMTRRREQLMLESNDVLR